MMKLAPPTSRILALSVLGLLLAAVSGFVVWPMIGASLDHRSDLEIDLERLAAYEAAKAEQSLLARRLTELRGAEADGMFFIDGPPGPQAASALQRNVRVLIEGDLGVIASSQIIPDREEGRLRRLGVQMDFTARTSDLQKILNAIETARPFYFIDNITIRSAGSYYGAGADSDTPLSVHLDVSGYARLL